MDSIFQSQLRDLASQAPGRAMDSRKNKIEGVLSARLIDEVKGFDQGNVILIGAKSRWIEEVRASQHGELLRCLDRAFNFGEIRRRRGRNEANLFQRQAQVASEIRIANEARHASAQRRFRRPRWDQLLQLPANVIWNRGGIMNVNQI